jgi:hypothetical protein
VRAAGGRKYEGGDPPLKVCTVVRRIKEDGRLANFIEIPIQTPVCRFVGIAKAKDGGIDGSDCPKGDAGFPGQVNSRSNAQNVKKENNTSRPEGAGSKAGALGLGGVNLRLGLSLVCGLVVHAEKVAQDRTI